MKSSNVKSRLSPVLSKVERGRLERLMLSGVLEAIGGAGLLPATRVVSSDVGVLRLSASLGAGTVKEARDEGVNRAVHRGVEDLGWPSKVLVLPSDLPLLRATDVAHLISLGRRARVVISPSRTFNGTNALIFSPQGGPPLSYDQDSFWNHLRGSARKDLSVAVVSDPRLTFDVDSPDDLRRLALSGSATPTAAYARSLLH